MNSYLVLEVRVWLLLVLLLVVAAAVAVGVWFLLRWIRAKRTAAVAETQARAEADALQRRNRMLIRLDHELKNPLTALRTSVATVRSAADDDMPDGSVISASARQIDNSARRVARLLADLRKLADVESRSIDFRRVDMDGLIHQAVEDARTAPGAEDRMIVATVARAPWKLPDVLGEEDLLLSAILNLLGNAIKYSSDTDTVELRANEQIIDKHRWVVVEVADTGSGIPVDEQQSVWDELHRGSRVRSVAGSGMGLSLVRAIVTRHGGSVELFSQEGVGTSVRLVIPVLGDAPPPDELDGYGARAAASSRPVQPFQDQKVHSGSGAGQLVPPREPNSEERRIMGTPRRTSKRRMQTVNGELVDTSTGETFGPTGGEASSAPPGGGVPPGPPGAGVPPGTPGYDSGPYRRFKPPHGSTPASSPQQPIGSPPGGVHQGGPQHRSHPGTGPQGVPAPGHAPQATGSGPFHGYSGPQPQPGSQPPHGSPPQHSPQPEPQSGALQDPAPHQSGHVQPPASPTGPPPPTRRSRRSEPTSETPGDDGTRR